MQFEVETDKAFKINANQPARPARERPIYVAEDWYDEIVRMVKEFVGDHMLAVVVDDEVARLFPERLQSLYEALPRVRIKQIKGGETAKTMQMFVELQQFLLDNEFHRDDHILSMGGGSISDLTGFVAATYIRGMSWISVPTTLIAQADCAVGGKSAVNAGSNKSYYGVFYWPNVILTDLSFLSTLSPRHYRSAIPEITKLALIGNEGVFRELCEACREASGYEGIKSRLKDFVISSATQKATIAACDPYQQGLRVVLLTGHTTAHALEGASNMHLHHGEAVAIGLAFESFISEKRGLISAEDRRALVSLLEGCQLPTVLPTELHDRVLLDCMRRDKRNRGRFVNAILPYHPGRAVEDWPAPRTEMSLDELWSELNAYRVARG